MGDENQVRQTRALLDFKIVEDPGQDTRGRIWSRTYMIRILFEYYKDLRVSTTIDAIKTLLSNS